jgi:hypothetical protein
MRLKQRTGAATFEIHILAKVETNIFARIICLGFVPALERTKDAIDLAMLCLLKAEAKENPPSRSMITGPNISILSMVFTSKYDFGCCFRIQANTIIHHYSQKNDKEWNQYTGDK